MTKLEDWTDEGLSAGKRLVLVADLIQAIYLCHPEDAEHVLSVILEEWRSGMPLPTFLDVESDAKFWAHTATFEELRAIFFAAGRKLARYPLGRRGRLRLVKRLVEDLTAEERRDLVRGLAEGNVET